MQHTRFLIYELKLKSRQKFKLSQSFEFYNLLSSDEIFIIPDKKYPELDYNDQ